MRNAKVRDRARAARAAEEEAWRKKNAAEKACEAAIAEEVEARDLDAITADVGQAVRYGRFNVEKVGGGVYEEAEALADLASLIERVKAQAVTPSQIGSLVTGQR